MRYSIPIFPVILFDSGIIIFELSSFEAFKKHSSKVLHGIISASLSIDMLPSANRRHMSLENKFYSF